MEASWKKVNLNNNIKFQFGNTVGVEIPEYLKPDSEGWYKMQLHEFMRVFGKHLYATMDPLIKPEVLIWDGR